MQPKIILLGPPIGNREDFSPRAIQTLKSADVIYAEHPETSKRLTSHFQIGQKRWVLFDQDSQQERIESLIQDSHKQTVVVVSRAGMPGVNDPGARLVHELLERNIAFDVIPGPSIVSCLMATSGEMGPFHYFGYLVAKSYFWHLKTVIG